MGQSIIIFRLHSYAILRNTAVKPVKKEILVQPISIKLTSITSEKNWLPHLHNLNLKCV